MKSLYYRLKNTNSELIEVKASDNTQSKSLNAYVKKYNPKYSIRVSGKNFGFEIGNLFLVNF